MKSKFSASWSSSTQPRKQRKYRLNAPDNVRRIMMSASLDKPLKEKYGRRNFPLKVGDAVKVMRGNFKGKEGKIEVVDLKKLKVAISGCEVVKVNGQKSKVFVDPSNVMIKTLNLDDKLRVKALERASKK